MNRAVRFRMGIAALVLALSWASGSFLETHAEVGLAPSPASGPATQHLSVPYILGITEDPNPVPPISVWRRLYPDGQGRLVLNPEGEANGDGPPSVLLNPVSGLPIVAWARNSAQGFDVVLSRYADGAWATPEVVAGGAGNQLDPALLLGPDGSVHLLFWVDGPAPTVFHMEAPPDLTSWSDAVQVSQPGECAVRPDGFFHDGILRVVYEVHDHGFGATPRQVVLSRREGSDFIPEVMAITSYAGEVRPQVHSHNGRLWVDWVDAETELAWVRLDAGGHWEAIRYESFSTFEERDYLARGTVKLKALVP